MTVSMPCEIKYVNIISLAYNSSSFIYLAGHFLKLRQHFGFDNLGSFKSCLFQSWFSRFRFFNLRHLRSFCFLLFHFLFLRYPEFLSCRFSCLLRLRFDWFFSFRFAWFFSFRFGFFRWYLLWFSFFSVYVICRCRCLNLYVYSC